MTDQLVQATRPFVGRVAGQRVLVRAGDLFAAGDPVVAAFGDKFRAPLVRSTPKAPPPKPKPAPEPNAGVIAEFDALELSNEADIDQVADALAKLDEITLAALLAEHGIEEETPEAALHALAATRYHPVEPTRKELLEEAARQGISVKPRATKAEIRAALDAG